MQAVVIAAGLDGLKTKADPGKRHDNDMYAQPELAADAPRLPLNMLDALRTFDTDAGLKSILGEEFSAAFLKLKLGEWNSYTSHLTEWERETTLDI